MQLTPPKDVLVPGVRSGRRTASVQSHQILTINVEDYFQVGVFHRFIDPRHWYRFDSRLEHNIDTTLQLLSEANTRATFFVLGWIAEKHPELVRRISDAGHEVASRGYLHQSLLTLDRAARSEDLTDHVTSWKTQPVVPCLDFVCPTDGSVSLPCPFG